MKKRLLSLLITMALVIGMLPGTAASATAHSHTLCGESSCGCASYSHSSQTWTAWDGTNRMYKSNGYYYLTEDIVLDSTMILDYSYTTYLCLNGHTITCDEKVFDIYSLRTLHITDCVGTGKIETTGSGYTIGNSKNFVLWGGTVLNSGEGAVIGAYQSSSTYIRGGRVESTDYDAIYAQPNSKVYIEGGVVHGGKQGYAISGHGLEGGTSFNLVISGGSLTDDSGWGPVEVQGGSFTMSGGYVGGDVFVYDETGTTTISGGTIAGMVDSSSQIMLITGGNLGLLRYVGETTISAGTFHANVFGGCNVYGSSSTINGGDFSACDVVSVENAWICGGSFNTVRVSDGPLYLSGVPGIDTIRICNPRLVSAQNPDGTGSYGGDPVEVVLHHSSGYVWKDGDIVIQNVTSDAVAEKFVLAGAGSEWQYLERSGNNLVLRMVPHGTWGDNVNWVVQDGVLTISGTGEIQSENDGPSYPWYEYRSKFTEIVVEEGITWIPSYTFEYLTDVTSITLPETLTYLALNAFNNCESLNYLVLPASLREIPDTNFGQPAFWRCYALTDVYYMGTAQEWSRLPYYDKIYSGDSEMTLHFLELYEKPATCTTSGTESYYQFDDMSYYDGKYDLNKQPITRLATIPALGHRSRSEVSVQVDPLIVTNTSAVPFVQSENTYTSANKSKNSSSEITIEARYDCTLTLQYGVSSASDKLYVLQNGTQMDSIYGLVSGKTMTLSLEAGDVVVVRYRKDSDDSFDYAYQDCGWVTLDYEEITVIEETSAPLDETAVDCTSGVFCDYCQEEVYAPLGHRVIISGAVPVDPLTVTNTSAVPFAKSGNTYTSANKSGSSSSAITVEALYDCTLTLQYGVSSEPSYDKLYVLLNGIQKDVISGTVSDKTMTLSLKVGDVVTVRYQKDGSVDKNQDCGWVTLVYEEGVIVEDQIIPADEVEPNCTEEIVCDFCSIVIKEPTSHAEVPHEGKQPTCAVSGWKAYVTCENCDYTTYEELEATGEHTLDAYGKCTTCQTAEAPVGYDRGTATIVVHNLPEHTEKVLIAVYSAKGQMLAILTGDVGVTVSLPSVEGAYRICVFYLDAAWNPVADGYTIFW